MSLDSPQLKAKDKPDLSSFDWADPFLLNAQLEEDERLIAESARTFAQENLQQNLLHPDQAAAYALPLLAKGRVAMVFGREDRGLKTEELDLCQRLITIPTDDRLPSMNLAQSVAVCLYEFARSSKEGKGEAPGRKLATNHQLEDMFGHMRTTFQSIDYIDPQNPEHILRAYRRFLGRAALDPREVRILRGLLSQIDWLDSERRRLDGEGDE